MAADTAFEIGRMYVQVKRIADLMTAGQSDVFIRLPGLLAYWPMGIRGENGPVVEHGGQGTPLIETGSCPVGYDGDAYTHLGDGVNYLDAIGFGGLSGTETFVDSTLNGFTIGGWFWPDVAATGTHGLVTKDAASPQRGYAVTFQLPGKCAARVTGNGITVVSVISGAVAINAWHFVVGRYIPSVEVSILVDGTKTTNTTSVPASQFTSSANFEVGRDFSLDARIFHGRARDVFVCQAQISDEILESVRLATFPLS